MKNNDNSSSVNSNSSIQFFELTHESPEFDTAYDIISAEISPECVETRDFLQNRLRVRDEGAKTEKEKILVQDGYTLHLIVAKVGERVVGAIYGHLISRIGSENRAIGFVTYIAVIKEYRRRGIGSKLVEILGKRLEQDSLELTGKPVFGMVYEVETKGKKEIKGLIQKFHGKPLDIVYHQPSARKDTGPVPMDLWFYPLNPPLTSSDELISREYPADFIISLVKNLFTMEYVGPDLKGFDLRSKPR